MPWPALEEEGDITHVGGKHLFLPGRVNKLIWLVDTTNKNEVLPTDNQWPHNYTNALSKGTSGQAVEFKDSGLFPAMTAVSGPLAMYSTDASDVVGVYLQGDLVPSGSSYSLEAVYNKYRGIENISTNGQTPVTTSNIFIGVQSIGKTADADGALVIQCGGETIGIIGPLEDESTYRRFELMKVSSAGTQFKYRGYIDPPKLIESNQVIPPDVSFDFVVWKATSDIFWDMRETERAMLAKKEAGQIAEQHIKQEEMFGAGNGGRIIPEDLE